MLLYSNLNLEQIAHKHIAEASGRGLRTPLKTKQVEQVLAQSLAEQYEEEYVKAVIGVHESVGHGEFVLKIEIVSNVGRNKLQHDYNEHGTCADQVADGKRHQTQSEFEARDSSAVGGRDFELTTATRIVGGSLQSGRLKRVSLRVAREYETLCVCTLSASTREQNPTSGSVFREHTLDDNKKLYL